MALNCDLNTLINLAKCIQGECVSQADRDAIDIYLKIVNLSASGGTNYVGNILTLENAAKKWVSQSPEVIDAIRVQISLSNAVANGGSVVDPTISVSYSAILQLTQVKLLRSLCKSPYTANALKSFLRCAINTLGKPD